MVEGHFGAGWLALSGWQRGGAGPGEQPRPRLDPRTLLPAPAPKLIREEICLVPVPVGSPNPDGSPTSRGDHTPANESQKLKSKTIKSELQKLVTRERFKHKTSSQIERTRPSGMLACGKSNAWRCNFARGFE